jgi:hypothetical protein
MSETKPEPRKIDPKALSPEYHKARKQLMLWSAILFIWELVGIDFEKAKEAGGNAGAIIGAIRSPQAVPWALLILVVYFLIKCWIEWAQCHHDRKKVLYARIDFYLAGFVGLLSIALYVGQSIRRIQFANLGGRDRIVSFVVVIVATIVSGVVGNVAFELLRSVGKWVSHWRANLKRSQK